MAELVDALVLGTSARKGVRVRVSLGVQNVRMAELVDALRSKRSVRKDVRVQFPLWTLIYMPQWWNW